MRHTVRARRLVVSIVGVTALLLSGCATSNIQPSGENPTLTFWTRSTLQDFDKRLVDAWNATHETQIKLTVIPAGDFVTKFATASSSGNAPDLAAVDVIYMPNFNEAGQFEDLTERVNALEYKDDLVKAHLDTSTADGKIYAVPHSVDGSALFYNKNLFKAAGLDPERPPTNWSEIKKYSEAITALGDDNYGWYFGGNCPGCQAYTGFPMIWGSGGDVMNEDGTQSTVDSQEVKDYLAFTNDMVESKLVPPSARSENGSTWVSSFLTGKIGMVGIGTFAIPSLKADAEFEWGLAPLPGKDGGSASFVGGDSIGIPRAAKNADAAWEFIEWTLSEEAQVEIIAKSGALTARTDLADNKYTAADPRLKTNNELVGTGRTPYSLVYNALYNDANGPWLVMLRKGGLQGQVDPATAEAQTAMQKIMDNG